MFLADGKLTNVRSIRLDTSTQGSASSARPLLEYVIARLFCMRECSSSEAPMRRIIANSASSRTTRPRGVLQQINRSQARFIAVHPKAVRLRPAHIRLPARPPERAPHDAVVPLLAQAARCHRSMPLRVFVVNCSPRPPRPKSSPAPPSTTHAQSPPSRGTHTCARALLRLPMQRLRADVARLPLGVLRAFLGRDRDGLRVLLICVVLLRAACLFYLLAERVVAALFPVLHLAFGPAVACAAAAAFLAQGQAKLGGADGALREDHLVYGQIARGQPYDAKS